MDALTLITSLLLLTALPERGIGANPNPGILTLHAKRPDLLNAPYRGANLNPGIIPPHAKPYGKSYGEWSALWWQWAFKQPVTGSPLMDATGADAAGGQTGPVWFLAGMYNTIEAEPGHWLGVAVRDITVPVGKALFFPILNSGADNVGCDPPYTVPELWAIAHANLASATNMACEIDGVPVQGLSNLFTTPYRAESPVFSYWLPPEDNFWQFYGIDFSGTVYPAVSDGVYLMLAPLSRGRHMIHFRGDMMSPAGIPYFTLDITYNITVIPPATRFNNNIITPRAR